MDDNIIISIISKTYFNIVSFFIFIFLLLFIIFVTLQNGLFIQEINFSTVSIKQLYIKWNEKIEISVENITLRNSDTSKSSSIEAKDIKTYLKVISHTTNWFQTIVVKNLSYNDINASFSFHEGENSFFIAHSKDINLSSSIHLSENYIHLKINNFKDTKKNINIKGDFYFDANETTIYSNTNISIAQEIKLSLYTKVGTEKLFYKIVNHKDIQTLTPIINLLSLSKEIKFWAYDAIDASSIVVNRCDGFLEYSKMDEAIKNIHVKLDLKNLNYTYNFKLDAIHTKHTELDFKDGILYIYPREAYSYGHFLGSSWIKIDFMQKEELLTLKLLFDAILDKNILTILDTFKIKLPFLQNSGTVDTDLTLKIGLRNISVDAQGIFRTKKANFDYLGLNIDIFDAIIKLDNYDVSIKNMYAEYQDIAKAHVDVNYNAKQAEGKILFRVDDISLSGIKDVKRKKPLHITYNMNPKGDTIELPKSSWTYKEKLIELDETTIPFNLETYTLNIPTTFIKIPGISTAYIAGSLNVVTLLSNFTLDILTFKYDGIEFTQSLTPIEIKYKENELLLKSDENIYFSVAGSRYKIDKLYAVLDENSISLKRMELEIGKYITTRLNAKYNIKTNKSHISLSKFTIKDPNTGKTLYFKKKILIGMNSKNDIIEINSKELGATFSSQDTGWRLHINALNDIVSDSPFLKKLNLSKGSFTIYKNSDDKYTRFKADVIYPFKVFIKNSIPTDEYQIKGRIYKEKVYITLNDTVNITIKEKINVNLHQSIVNIFEVTRMTKALEKNSSQSKPLDIVLQGNNSYIYITKQRKILYDKLALQFHNRTLNAQLKHKSGEAGLHLQNKKFDMFGKNFNDTFMNALFSFSKFNGGTFDFAVDGTLTKYKGVGYINNANIKEYKMLNNILAFVNTVPSLITFSIPGYSKNGLFINNAYTKFSALDNVFNLSDIYLHSKEIDILGKGNIDLNKNNMDISLNLKTDLGSSFSQVPLVGYIILDEDSISTTLSIKGDLNNPKINSQIAKEIVVAPLNIIKRTLSLPYKLIKDALDMNNSN